MRNKIIGIILAILSVSCSPEISQEDYIRRELPKYVWEQRVEEGFEDYISDYYNKLIEYYENELDRYCNKVQRVRDKKLNGFASMGMDYETMEAWGFVEDRDMKEAKIKIEAYINRSEKLIAFLDADCKKMATLIDSAPNYFALRDTLDRLCGYEDSTIPDYEAMFYNEFGTIDGPAPQDYFFYEDLSRIIRAFLYQTRIPSISMLKFDRKDKIWKACVNDDEESIYLIKVSVLKSGKVTMDVHKSNR